MKILIFILIGLLFGCSSVNSSRPVDYVIQYKELPDCPRPNRPILDKIDPNQHVGSIDNVSAYDDLIMLLMNYTLQLESTIDCYESRKKNSGESNE